MHKIIIAIDGYSSCGKSTLAKQLAKTLEYRFIDSGAMYRAVTLYLINHQIDIYNLDAVAESLKNIKIDFKINPENHLQETYLNDENVEMALRINSRIASIVSDVSAISEVRRFLVKQQQFLGNEKGIVMDGRDIGTVVFPHAELKIFVTADPQIRAQRRFDELKEKGQTTTIEEVLANLQKRDHIDTTRADSPLVKAEDAIVLDTSNMNREQQFQFAYELTRKKLGVTSE
ncbi:MAG: (d)CMP kinase [Bacteroidota bacterium]